MLEDNQTHRPSKCPTFNTARHIFGQAQLSQNIISKSVCLLGTTDRVIRLVETRVKTGIWITWLKKRNTDHLSDVHGKERTK